MSQATSTSQTTTLGVLQGYNHGQAAPFAMRDIRQNMDGDVSFDAAGRLWVFCHNDTNSNPVEFFASTVDGSSWVYTTVYSTFNRGSRWAFYRIPSTDSFIYASNHFSSSAHSYDLVYRKGIFNSDGSISWDSAEQNIIHREPQFISDLVPCTFLTIGMDGAGLPYIGYEISRYTSSIVGWNITKSSSLDTWSTASGYPIPVPSGVASSRIQK